jgi:hypothetical protein
MSVPSPRQMLDQHLATERVTPVDWARQQGVAFEAVYTLLQGDYPPLPEDLHKIGCGLKADAGAWSAACAAGLARLSADDAAKSLKGRLWAYLILHNLSVTACAAKWRTTPRVLQLALSSGNPSPRFRQTGLLHALGFSPEDLPDDGPRRSAPSEPLKQLLTNAINRQGVTLVKLAEVVGRCSMARFRTSCHRWRYPAWRRH